MELRPTEQNVGRVERSVVNSKGVFQHRYSEFSPSNTITSYLRPLSLFGSKYQNLISKIGNIISKMRMFIEMKF
jgi:hypothetical protein